MNPQIKSGGTAEALAWLATGRLGGAPVVALFAVAPAGVAAIVLARLAFGWHLAATGQGWDAARLAGVRIGRTTATAFVASRLLAVLTGMLLSAYAGGAFLEMGSPYLLQTVGAVVLGGTLISGGSATLIGRLSGVLRLVLIIVTMQIAALRLGTQGIVQGVANILALALGGLERTR